MDDIHRGTVEYVASQHLVPVVATGNVVMHVRSRKPLQDTMTAIRLGKPVAQCGYELAPNAEQHLRSRLRLANLYPEHALTETLSIAASAALSRWTSCATNIPTSWCRPASRTTAYLRQETYIGAHRRFPHGIPHEVQEQIEHELQLIARSELRARTS